MSILKASASRKVELRQIQQTLGASEAILTFVLAEPRSYCLVITRRGARIVSLAGQRAIESRISAYRKAVQAKLPATSEAQDLYRLLLQPINETARVRRLVIVRDGQLHLIPFDALVTPSGAYVLQTRTVQYSLSATTYHLLRQSPSRGNGQAKDLAALAVGGVPPSTLVQFRQFVYRGQRLGMLRSKGPVPCNQHPLACGQCPLKQRFRLLIQCHQVVHGGQRAGVFCSQVAVGEFERPFSRRQSFLVMTFLVQLCGFPGQPTRFFVEMVA